MHTLLPLTESTDPGGECKQSQDSYVKLMPVQKAQIAKYALASGSKAAVSCNSIKIHKRVSD